LIEKDLPDLCRIMDYQTSTKREWNQLLYQLTVIPLPMRLVDQKADMNVYGSFTRCDLTA
jgi:hypothetical protein